MPKTRSASPSTTADRASAGSSRASDTHTPQTATRRALPNRRQSVPISAIVMMAPADTPSSAIPRAAGDAPTAAFTAGMRTAQLAKTKPSMAKTVVMAARTRLVSLRAGTGSGILYSTCTKSG